MVITRHQTKAEIKIIKRICIFDKILLPIEFLDISAGILMDKGSSTPIRNSLYLGVLMLHLRKDAFR